MDAVTVEPPNDVGIDGVGTCSVGVAAIEIALLDQRKPSAVKRVGYFWVQMQHSIKIGDRFVRLVGFKIRQPSEIECRSIVGPLLEGLSAVRQGLRELASKRVSPATTDE